MDYEAAKLRIIRHRHSSVYCLEHLITSSLTNLLSMGFDIGFMTPTDAAKDLDHRSMHTDNMEYTRTIHRTLKPDLGRCFDSQVAPQQASSMTTRRKRGFTQADEQGESIGLAQMQGVTEETGRSKKAKKQTMSRRPLSKDSGQIITVSMKHDALGEAVPG